MNSAPAVLAVLALTTSGGGARGVQLPVWLQPVTRFDWVVTWNTPSPTWLDWPTHSVARRGTGLQSPEATQCIWLRGPAVVRVGLQFPPSQVPLTLCLHQPWDLESNSDLSQLPLTICTAVLRALGARIPAWPHYIRPLALGVFQSDSSSNIGRMYSSQAGSWTPNPRPTPVHMAKGTTHPLNLATHIASLL